MLDSRAAAPLGAQAVIALCRRRLEGRPRLVAVSPQAPAAYADRGRSQHHPRGGGPGFDGVRVGATALLADEAVAWLEPRLIAATGALQLGVSVGQLRRTVEYVSQRKQFGRVIGAFQRLPASWPTRRSRSGTALGARRLVYRLMPALGALPRALAVKVLANAAHLVGTQGAARAWRHGVDITYPIHRYLYWSRWLAGHAGRRGPHAERLGDWLADHDQLGWKYDLPEDTGQPAKEPHALG